MFKKKESLISLVKRWAPVTVIILLMVLSFIFGLHEKISLDTFLIYKDDLQEYVAAHQLMSVLGFLIIYIVIVALSLPVATIMSLAGGFFFGNVLGTIYVVAAATMGATIIFLVARSTLGSSLRERAGDLYKRIEANMQENAVSYLLFMRLVPLFPFFLVNIVPAIFNVSLRVFVMTTLFGIMPGSFVYVNLGQALGDIDGLEDIVSGETILAFTMLGILSLLPSIYKQLKARKNAG
jgi:uncharacterized membrane protein YdjX (TVP38/TMEM64 family)